MTRSLMIAALFAVSFAAPGGADEVTDALHGALDAYNDGDVKYALEELDYARQLMIEMKAQELERFLPAAPDGWTREINTELNAGLAMMGGGTGAEAQYGNGNDQFTITIMANNPMVGAMAGMLGGAAAIGARIERIGRQKFMVQDGEYTGLVDSRILVKAAGDRPEVIKTTLELMDFNALSDFGR